MGRGQPAVRARRTGNAADSTAVSATSHAWDIHSHPVSLLWAHQLRRENATLLQRIEGLAKDVGSNQPDIDRLAKTAQKVAEGITGLKTENEWDRKRVRGLEQRLGRVEEQAQSVKEDLKGFGVRVEKIEREVKKVSDLEDGLGERVSEIEEGLRASPGIRIGRQDVILVKDSMEGLGRLMKTRERERRRVPDHSSDHHAANEQAVEPNNPKPPSDTQSAAFPNHNSANLLPVRTSSSIAGDVDLDEHFNTVNYAGHNPYGLRSHPPLDSLVMLPELARNNPPKVKKVSDVKQVPSQNWGDYLVEGQRCFDTLPRHKEGELVEAFIRGICDQERKQDCKNWLDERSWTWENVKAFDDHLARAETQDPAPIEEDALNGHRPDQNLDHEATALLPSRATCAALEASETVPQETIEKNDFYDQPIERRRSQMIAHLHLDKRSASRVKVRMEMQLPLHHGDIQRVPQGQHGPRSYQRRQQFSQVKTKPQFRLIKSASGDIGAHMLVTPPDQILPHPTGDTEPYTLPPIPAKSHTNRQSLLSPEGVMIIPAKEGEKRSNLGRKRKRDYKGHLVTRHRSTSLVTEGPFPEQRRAEAQIDNDIESGLLNLLQGINVRKKKLPGIAESEISKHTKEGEASGYGVAGRGFGSKLNEEYWTGTDASKLKPANLHNEKGSTGDLVQRRVRRFARIAVKKKTMPQLASMSVESGKAESKGPKAGGRVGRARRMPPEIPILPSTPSEDESQ